MAKMNELMRVDLRQMGNMTHSKPVLAMNAAGAATVRTTNAIDYSVDGVMYTKAALAAQALTPIPGEAGFYTQPASTTVYYALCLNSAGAVGCVQGRYAGQPYDVPGIGAADGSVPNIPAGWTPFGLIKVATGAAATFLPGTTVLDAAGLTVTYWDVSLLPVQDRP